ncbi:MAG: NADH-quinone oxidoreductase subunit J [Deltaproteobacteria bacterium]|nr:NADH-quinone oxidoreductase subunit J [Deltaproteobacteria bacterium]NIS76130.1 NADH-quinone oxidoreductase subunit J [Deltaproteobacteria bacterium]
MKGPADIIFYAIAFVTVVSAVLVALLPNIIHAAIALLFTFAGVAGLYVFMSADFLAATQLLIYVGGILVLILFAVFLSSRISSVKMSNPARFMIPAGVAFLGILGGLIYALHNTQWAGSGEVVYDPTTAKLGELLMTKYLLPFEVASVLLLAALVGAALLSRPGD